MPVIFYKFVLLLVLIAACGAGVILGEDGINRRRSIRRASIWLRALVACVFLFGLVSLALARDPDGRYANSPLHDWFDHLANAKNDICCSVADGRPVADDDWGTKDGHYWVRVLGDVAAVPDSAMVKGPNRAGHAMVWVHWLNGKLMVRCFLPGTET